MSRGGLVGWLTVLVVSAIPVLAFPGGAAAAAGGAPPAPVAAVAGGDTLVPGWMIQSSAVAGTAGATISRPGQSTAGWFAAPGRSTVLGALVDDGRFGFDPWFSNNLTRIDATAYQVPWWFREDLDLGATPAPHTALRVNGIIPRADVWVNGKLAAGRAQVAGAYDVKELDVTALVHAGQNTVALLVYPSDPLRDLIPGWIDWNQWPPDNNMGPWRGVDVLQSGPVALRGAHVQSSLALPGLGSADLTVKVDAHNQGSQPVTTTVGGTVAPSGTTGGVAVQQTVTLAAGETRTLTFAPASQPQLRVASPQVWWPAQLGAQPLYDLSLAATVGGTTSDTAGATFGIRDVRSQLTSAGSHRQFVVNGKPLLIRGGGWAPDMFLRYRPDRIEQDMRYTRDVGLNAIRLEGKLETDAFYQLADRYGILALPGWDCCDKWEAWAGTGGQAWTAEDFRVAGESMASEAQLTRNHPSVIGFLIGSDNAPPANVASVYLNALHQSDWPNPIIAAASAQSDAAGASGMKMDGPYDWEPPGYWYTHKAGAAFGFASEVSAGNMIPTLDSLRKFMSASDLDQLWRTPKAKQFHASPSGMGSPFETLRYFDTALAQRTGKPTSLDDYVEKAQLMNYEANRAQFEAYARNVDAADPATGVVFWMLNNAWPSLHWHLYDSSFEPAGAYFGARKAAEPLHVQWSYDDRSVAVVDQGAAPASGLSVEVNLRNLDGTKAFSRTVTGVSVASLGEKRVLTVPTPSGLSTTYFAELTLRDASGATVSRNVYWLSAKADVLNFGKTTWWYTPETSWADLTGLAGLPQTSLSMTAASAASGGQVTTTVTLTNPAGAKTVGFFAGLKVRQGPGGAEVLPITWSDNYVTLWPGQSVTVQASYRAADVGGAVPTVDLSGWNVANQRVSAPAR